MAACWSVWSKSGGKNRLGDGNDDVRSIREAHAHLAIWLRWEAIFDDGPFGFSNRWRWIFLKCLLVGALMLVISSYIGASVLKMKSVLFHTTRFALTRSTHPWIFFCRRDSMKENMRSVDFESLYSKEMFQQSSGSVLILSSKRLLAYTPDESRKVMIAHKRWIMLIKQIECAQKYRIWTRKNRKFTYRVFETKTVQQWPLEMTTQIIDPKGITRPLCSTTNTPELVSTIETGSEN